MIRTILFFSVIFFFISCKESLPPGVIKQKKMQDVMWDVFRADALSRQIVSADSSKSLKDETVKLTEKAFSINNTTREQFEKSYYYYIHHPDIMKTMLDSLNARQTRISNLELTHRSKQLQQDSATVK